jgi:hypothetical protein
MDGNLGGMDANFGGMDANHGGMDANYGGMDANDGGIDANHGDMSDVGVDDYMIHPFYAIVDQYEFDIYMASLDELERDRQ